MLGLRVASSLVLIPILVVAAWLGDPWTTIVVATFAAAAAYEFMTLAERAGYEPLKATGILIALLFVGATSVQANFLQNTGRELIPIALTIALIAVLAVRLLRRQATTAFGDWAITLGGALWTGWLLAHWVLLRDVEPDGRSWVIVALLLTFTSDTAAYAVGRTLGRHRLVPAISPKKTWEGAIGSLIATPLAAAGLMTLLALPPFAAIGLNPPLTPLLAAGIGVAVSLAAQLGDLVESAIKRSAQVKDASGLIPGHGGVLDRIDSLTFVVVVVYYLGPLLTR
ncbi:MAG: phosphatidate cytidylyltransferase [Chloroflexota bacterium]|nr:phosphatidate cytidylyltransferase [Dehalococcoidia bacterium]MDW8253518.1 phosphatidate cytidylyltransferase [Chloroflexota bacterium]